MGGVSNSQIEANESRLASQFLGNSNGYQQPNQVAPISAPQYPSPLTPSPEQAAAATKARIMARTPMAAPAAAPKVAKPRVHRSAEGGR